MLESATLKELVRLVLFGLTGGLASGKSSVAARFRTRGLPIIDADQVSREVVAPGSAGLQEIVAVFGADVLQPDGSLDRKKLAERAFADPDQRRRLESITHPRIAEATTERARELELTGEPLACYEATLLVERGLADAFRPLVVVASPEAAQIARAMERDRLSEAEARARLSAQLPTSAKIAAADYVIQNDGDKVILEARADAVLDQICRTKGIDPARYPKPHA